jgi:hypothetical protein
MRDYFLRIWTELAGRVTGPMTFRLVLQPLTAAFFGIRSGLRDAREGRPPYVWSLFAHGDRRRENLLAGWSDLGRVILFAVVLDLIYQGVVLRAFHPVDAALVACVLVILPYAAIRGGVNRLARAFRSSPPAPPRPSGPGPD